MHQIRIKSWCRSGFQTLDTWELGNHPARLELSPALPTLSGDLQSYEQQGKEGSEAGVDRKAQAPKGKDSEPHSSLEGEQKRRLRLWREGTHARLGKPGT